MVEARADTREVPETVALRARRRDLVEVRSEIRAQNADAVAVALPARYRITYRTLANDLSTPG